jgi:hypothetical protein
MGHIRHLFPGYSLFGFSLRVWGGMTEWSGSGGSTVLRRRGCLVVVIALLAGVVASDAIAQPRGAAQRPQQQQPPALPPSGHQTEPVDLNEGKSPAELFSAGCAVCHQSANGLAKGRREGELTNFLRQHYTSSVQHAGALANFLASRGPGGPAVAAPSRQPPVDRPPAPVGREDRKPQEAARPPEREPASKRKPPVAAARTPPPAAPPPPEPEPEPTTSASSPPVEEKPPAPEIPL